MINLSNYEFSKATYKLLNRNLNFVPTQSKYNENELDKSIENFYRKIKLTAYFGKNDQDKNLTEEDIFKAPSNRNWLPSETHHTVQTFIEASSNDIETEKVKEVKLAKRNLTSEEITALNQLKNRDDIVISNADKGGAVVIQDIKEYLREAKKQLKSTENYKENIKDPTTTHNNLINQVIERFKNERRLKENIAKGLKMINPRTPRFYTLPKIH